MCFWYNESCRHYPLPPNPTCPKIICTSPPRPHPEPSNNVWLIPLLTILFIVLLTLVALTVRLSYQMNNANQRRNHFDERRIVESLEAARQESDQLERDLQDITASLGIENENAEIHPEEQVETIEDAMRAQEEESRRAAQRREELENRRRAGLEAAAAAERAHRERSVRLRVLYSAVERRDEALANLRRALRRVPNINTRIQAVLQEQRERNETS